ncbi:hypothetical protein N6O34_22260, partial [Escherichia coli]
EFFTEIHKTVIPKNMNLHLECEFWLLYFSGSYWEHMECPQKFPIHSTKGPILYNFLLKIGINRKNTKVRLEVSI